LAGAWPDLKELCPASQEKAPAIRHRGALTRKGQAA
jgi:hypothetical protein